MDVDLPIDKTHEIETESISNMILTKPAVTSPTKMGSRRIGLHAPAPAVRNMHLHQGKTTTPTRDTTGVRSSARIALAPTAAPQRSNINHTPSNNTICQPAQAKGAPALKDATFHPYAKVVGHIPPNPSRTPSKSAKTGQQPTSVAQVKQRPQAVRTPTAPTAKHRPGHHQQTHGFRNQDVGEDDPAGDSSYGSIDLGDEDLEELCRAAEVSQGSTGRV
jgi:hypothetical protein